MTNSFYERGPLVAEIGSLQVCHDSFATLDDFQPVDTTIMDFFCAHLNSFYDNAENGQNRVYFMPPDHVQLIQRYSPSLIKDHINFDFIQSHQIVFMPMISSSSFSSCSSSFSNLSSYNTFSSCDDLSSNNTSDVPFSTSQSISSLSNLNTIEHFNNSILLNNSENPNPVFHGFNNLHWSLLIWKPHARSSGFMFSHYDSAGNRNKESAKNLAHKISMIYKLRNGRFINCKAPLQRNNYDCGIYVMAIMEYLSRPRPGIAEMINIITPQFISLYRKCTADMIQTYNTNPPHELVMETVLKRSDTI
ncbi:hypothetical protein TRFO_22117 [Tritrichomonas foetus]|uniref:Ubiquitin-like protease family profile domain-containing protein n=1 Tax=Tritrichomonas foetus TaxID=1144522 RepID=A0A1J4KH11_9EUKA|nr:hypothetical protein TRFO_22117 [Tritrichomonas foetus]|eukprot:OHT09116.1 hypothetical protein TRFO_22117 [Tritrichomonas foetus]